MLYQLNEKIKGIFAWIIIILVTITFVMFGIDYFLQARHTSNDVVAEVDGQPIPNSLFEQIYRRIQKQEQAPLSATQDNALKTQILDELILNMVTVNAANNFGFYLAPEEVMAAIFSFPQFQENGKFSLQRYNQILAASFYTPIQLQSEIATSMLVKQQNFAFKSGAFVLNSELTRDAALIFETRDYDYVKVPLSIFADHATVTEKEAHDYYNAHINQFTSKEKIVLDYLLLSIEKFKNTSIVTEEEIKQYYDDNRASFRAPETWRVKHILLAFPEHATITQQNAIKQKAEKIYQRLLKKIDRFESIAKTQSDDKLTARNEGLLPENIIAGKSPFATALHNLKQDDVSKPFKTTQGYEIFKIVNYIKAAVVPYNTAKTQIKTQLENEKAQLSYTKALEQLGEISYQHPESLKEASLDLQLPILHTEPLTDAGGRDQITQNPEVVKAAFSQDVNKLGNNSEPIQLTPTSVVVIRVQKRLPKEIQPFSKAQTQIEKQLKNELAQKMIKSWGEKIISGKNTLDHGLAWTKITNEIRLDENKNPEIHNLAFSLSKNHKIGFQYLKDGTYCLVRLEKIIPGQISNLDSKQKQQLVEQLENGYGTADYDIYINELMAKAKIKRF